MIAEHDTVGTLLKRYGHGPGSDEPLVEYDGSGTRTYLAADVRGSVVPQFDERWVEHLALRASLSAPRHDVLTDTTARRLLLKPFGAAVLDDQ